MTLIVKDYARREQPSIDGNDRKYLRDELQKVQQSISLANSASNKLNASVSANTSAISSNTSAISSNTSALAVLSANPVFVGSLSVNQTGNTVGAWDKVLFNSIARDTYAGWNSTTKRYTPPAGSYAIVASSQSDAAATAYTGVAVYKNGAASSLALSFCGAAAAAPATQATDFLQLNGTDYIEVYAFVSGAGGIIYPNFTFMKINRLA